MINKTITYMFMFVVIPLIGIAQPSNYVVLNGSESIKVGSTDDINTEDERYDRTVEFWFKADDVSHTDREVIYEEGGNVRGINFWVENGYVYLGIYNDADGTDKWYGTWFRTAISSGQWYHVALVLRAGDNTGYPVTLNEKLEWYLGGVLQDTGHGGVLHDHPGDIRISSTETGVFPKYPASWTNDAYEATANTQIEDKRTSHFTGAVGILRVWNSARTETQIYDNRNTLITTIEPDVNADGLVAYLNGDKVTDTGGDSGSDGTEMPNTSPTDLTYDNKNNNDDWTDSQNWYGSNTNDRGNLPSAGDDITIKDNGTGQAAPTIPAGTYYFSNITIANNNILSLGTNVYFNVTTKITNSGSLNINSSSINIRTIENKDEFNINDGYVLVETDFVNNTGTVVISSSAEMDVNNDFISIGGSFTIESDATGTGSLITYGAVTGSINVERYINYAGIGTLSSPVEDATSSVFTGLVGGGAYGIELMSHTEANRSSGNPYTPITAASATVLNTMEGYVFEMTNSGSTVTFPGVPNTGDQTFTLTSTQYNGTDYYGWNIIGNPYPSAITWTHLTGKVDDTKISATMYVYNGADDDADADSWLSFNPNDPNPSNSELDHIPVGGAFFVKLQDGQLDLTVTLTDAYRVHEHDNVNFGTVEGSAKKAKKGSYNELPNNYFQLVAIANGKEDKASYHWRDEATLDFDLKYDSYKMVAWGADNPNIFFWSGDEITSLQQETETQSVRVGYSSYTSGEVELSLENVTSFSEIILEDKLENKQIDILNNTYTFTSSSNDEDRFVLHLKKQTLSEVDDALDETKIYTNKSKVYLSFVENISDANVVIYDLQGRQVKVVELKNNQNHFEIETNLLDGVYVLKVNTSGKQISKTILLQQ